MIKHMLLAGAAAFATLSMTAGANAAADQAAAPAASAKKPQFGTWGFDDSGMDRSVKAGDDWIQFANGTWFKKTEIPADKPAWGLGGALAELSNERTRLIIEEAAKANAAAGTNQQKVGDFYASFMDESAIEAKGIAPLKPYLAKIDAIATPADLAHAFGEATRIGVNQPFGAQVEQDLKDNTRYSAYLGQGGIGLPDRDYYLVDNPKFIEARTRYQQHIANMLKLAGISEPEERAKRIYDLEKKIAEAHWSKVEQRQIDKLYNPMTQAELGKNMPGLDWSAFLKAAGFAGQPSIVIANPSALAGASKLAQSEPLQTWKDYLTFRTISSGSSLLPKAFVDESFAMSRVLSGTPQLPDRWKRGVSLVNGTMGEAVGQLYVTRFFPPESKRKADELVQNLIKAMDGRLANLAWMAPETRTKARAKLAAFTPKIGYPDKWRDYSKLQIVPGDAFGNARRAVAFERQRNLDKLGQAVDRSEWAMTPMTVNAYANPLLNEIVFPAAILQAPMFDANADDAVNYGAIGAVIGHEISHHFDDQGRKFDQKGNLADWWTADDVKRFEALSKQVVQQYAAYEPLPGTKVNGELTLGENIADLAGLAIAYDAYQRSLGGKPAPRIGGYTGDQRFFLGYTQAWRNKYRDAYLQQYLTTDEHTPGHYRPHVVRNFDQWYAAFDVKPGEKLYLEPEQRIKIW